MRFKRVWLLAAQTRFLVHKDYESTKNFQFDKSVTVFFTLHRLILDTAIYYSLKVSLSQHGIIFKLSFVDQVLPVVDFSKSLHPLEILILLDKIKLTSFLEPPQLIAKALNTLFKLRPSRAKALNILCNLRPYIFYFFFFLIIE